MTEQQYQELNKAFTKELFINMMKTSIRQRFPEPLASMYCLRLDNTKTLADFLECMAKQIRG